MPQENTLRKNVTLSLPADLLREARHLAVDRGTSLSGLLAQHLADLVASERDSRAVARRILQRLEKGYDLGSGGQLDVSREELHGR